MGGVEYELGMGLLYICPSTNSATLREMSFTSNLSPFITILVASDFSIVLGGVAISSSQNESSKGT